MTSGIKFMNIFTGQYAFFKCMIIQLESNVTKAQPIQNENVCQCLRTVWARQNELIRQLIEVKGRLKLKHVHDGVYTDVCMCAQECLPPSGKNKSR